MAEPPGRSENPPDNQRGRQRRLIQSRLHENLGKIPGIASVRYEDIGSGIANQVRGDIDTRIFADGLISADEAYVQVNWWPQPKDEPSWFQIHYTESSGFDCGWHRHVDDHVDGLDHYQQRESPEEEYQYRAVKFEAENPIGNLCEVVDGRLQDLLRRRYREIRGK